jgi:hypothetical protein
MHLSNLHHQCYSRVDVAAAYGDQKEQGIDRFWYFIMPINDTLKFFIAVVMIKTLGDLRQMFDKATIHKSSAGIYQAIASTIKTIAMLYL